MRTSKSYLLGACKGINRHHLCLAETQIQAEAKGSSVVEGREGCMCAWLEAVGTGMV